MPDRAHINDFKSGKLIGQTMAWYVTIVDHEGTRFDLKFPEHEHWKALNAITQAINARQRATHVQMSLRLA